MSGTPTAHTSTRRKLVLQDVLTLHGSQFRNAAVIVASPPCQRYSYMAMPWTRAKELAAWYREDAQRQIELNALFDSCLRIAKEAGIPIVIENVKGAQPWIGSAKWHYGSFYLWGDVPALMPMTLRSRKSSHVPMAETPAGVGATSWFHGNSKHEGRNYGMEPERCATKNDGGSWFNVAHNTVSGKANNPVSIPAGTKNPGLNWSEHGELDYKPVGFNVSNAQRYREEIK